MITSSAPLLRPMMILALALAVVIGGPLVVRQPAGPGRVQAADGTSTTKGITVQGTGRVTISPDLATISLSVQSQSTTAAKAQSQASAAMIRIIGAVKAQGIADADLTTQWISLAPQYDNGIGSSIPRLLGYQANQSLSVKVRHIEKAGAVIDAAVAAGATQVGGISFSVADPTAATTQARTAAVADARAQATALAHAAGISLGAVISLSEVAPAPTPIPYAAADLGAPSVKTPVQVGTTEVDVVVEVTFAIGT